jgi:hypothetical protein
MGKTTLARNRAMGVIGRGRVEAVEAAGVSFVDTAEQEKLIQRQAELEQEVARLRQALDEGPQTVAAHLLREAMGR